MQIAKHVLLETEDFVAVNKPAGMLTIPDRQSGTGALNLHDLLETRYGKVFTVHRLDRDTSGVVVFALNAETHKMLSLQFENRQVRKSYLGLVTGRVWEKEGSISLPVVEDPSRKGRMTTAKKGKEALTTFEVLESFSLYTLLKIHIFTGRTHQIRVHMKSIGHPIAMDEVYGSGKPFYLSYIKKKYRVGRFQHEEKPLMTRMALHAATLSFEDKKGQRLTVEAPLPKDFQAVVHQLRKHASVPGEA